VSRVDVAYAALDAASPVNADGWDKAIDWVVRQAGARLALSRIWDDYVKTPVAPFFALERVATGSAGDEWRGLSADVRLTAAVGGGGAGAIPGGALGPQRSGGAGAQRVRGRREGPFEMV
jgi:hypothetical protein